MRERREVHREGQRITLIGAVAFKKSRVRATASEHGEIVAFSSGDLRIEDAIERRGEVVVTAHIVRDFFRIGHPIQIPPDFAAMHLRGPLCARQLADCLQDGHDDRDVRVVFVRGIVRIDHAGLRRREDGFQIVFQSHIRRVFHDLAWIIELHHRRITPHDRGLPLLVAPHVHHLRVREFSVSPGARTAGAIRASHPAKPFRRAVKTRGNPVKRHEFQIILMRADAKMRDPRKRFGKGFAVGDEDVGGGIVEVHGRSITKARSAELSAVHSCDRWQNPDPW